MIDILIKCNDFIHKIIIILFKIFIKKLLDSKSDEIVKTSLAY